MAEHANQVRQKGETLGAGRVFALVTLQLASPLQTSQGLNTPCPGRKQVMFQTQGVRRAGDREIDGEPPAPSIKVPVGQPLRPVCCVLRAWMVLEPGSESPLRPPSPLRKPREQREKDHLLSAKEFTFKGLRSRLTRCAV